MGKDCTHERLDRVGCINVTQDKDKCLVVMNRLKESWVPEVTRKFLGICSFIRF
jgi:hypothetical protein